MGHELPSDNQPEFEHEAEIDRALVIGRLRELGVQEDLDYLLDVDEFDENVLLGEIVMLATMYDLDIDDILREATPIEYRRKNEDEVSIEEELA